MNTRRRQERRTPWLPFAIISLLVIAMLGVGGWYYWSGTVSYSLARLHRAITHHDRYLFEQHVDLAYLTRRLVDDFLDVEIQELKKEPLGPWEQLGATVGVTFAELIKPRLMEEVQYALSRGVESGAFARGEMSTEPRSSSHQSGDVAGELVQEFPHLKLRGRSHLRTHDGVATVDLPVQLVDGLPGEPKTSTLHVRLIRTPNRYWRATEIENFKDILRVWHERQEQRLALANQPAQEMLKELVTVGSVVSKEQGLNAAGTAKDVVVIVTLTNNTSSAIQGVIADITVRDAGGKLKTIQIQDTELIPPHETSQKVWPLNLHLSNDSLDAVDRLIYETPSARLMITVALRHLVLSDGREIKLFESLDELGPQPSTPQTPPAELSGV